MAESAVASGRTGFRARGSPTMTTRASRVITQSKSMDAFFKMDHLCGYYLKYLEVYSFCEENCPFYLKEREVAGMRKTDISSYAGAGGPESVSAARAVFKIFLKALLTVLTVFFLSGAIVLLSVLFYVFGMKGESVDYDLHKLQLNYTSFIYVNGPNDDAAHPVKYQSLYSSENRIWVDYDQIPQTMKDAVVAIEDKRYWEHRGVDWWRTLGATANLFNFAQASGGGSTITQQLIKNITGENEVSLTRKVKEIFRALNLERKYSKEEILSAYLNVVNFGSGCNGVQTAANLYFGKNIQDCDLAECAAIAGITRNPTAYSPLAHPDKNKARQQTVLTAMHDQKKITDAEYAAAMKESEHMKFVGKKPEDVVDENSVWNWYTETMFEDLKEGLMEVYSCSADKAIDMIYHGGLKIYSAMDSDMQTAAEEVFNDGKTFPARYQNLQGGYVSMDYSGRVLAVVGGKGKKESNRLFNLATDAKRQPGSSIKPLAVYGPAVNLGLINYSSLVNDEPLPNWKNGKPGPANADRRYHGKVTVEKALEQSYNAAAVQIDKLLTPQVSFNLLREKLGFTSLEPTDNTLAMAIGGLTNGVTVREMAAGFQIFGNGGKYYRPYTFYYVEDHDGNVILDNRDEVPTQALSSSSATIVRKLMNNVMARGTGTSANIRGWDVFGKTGTTNDNKDSWFVGGTPYAVAGIWTGYSKTPKALNKYETPVAKNVWKAVMTKYLKEKQKKDFQDDPGVVSALFCTQSGLLANPGVSASTRVGWYKKDSLPGVCNMSPGEESPESGAEDREAESESSESPGETSSGFSSETESEPGFDSDPGTNSTGPGGASSREGEPPAA